MASPAAFVFMVTLILGIQASSASATNVTALLHKVAEAFTPNKTNKTEGSLDPPAKVEGLDDPLDCTTPENTTDAKDPPADTVDKPGDPPASMDGMADAVGSQAGNKWGNASETKDPTADAVDDKPGKDNEEPPASMDGMADPVGSQVENKPGNSSEAKNPPAKMGGMADPFGTKLGNDSEAKGPQANTGRDAMNTSAGNKPEGTAKAKDSPAKMADPLSDDKAGPSDKTIARTTSTGMDVYKVVPTAPLSQAVVSFGNVTVEMGNQLTPTQVHVKPNVTWVAEKNGIYTLFMTDIDPSPPSICGQLQHWIVVNIPASDIDKGDAIFDFSGSAPIEGSGLHRYLFLVYKQQKRIEKTDFEGIRDVDYDIRRAYCLKDLLERFQLKNAVAGNFYQAQYDGNVPKYQIERDQKYNKYKLERY